MPRIGITGGGATKDWINKKLATELGLESERRRREDAHLRRVITALTDARDPIPLWHWPEPRSGSGTTHTDASITLDHAIPWGSSNAPGVYQDSTRNLSLSVIDQAVRNAGYGTDYCRVDIKQGATTQLTALWYNPHHVDKVGSAFPFPVSLPAGNYTLEIYPGNDAQPDSNQVYRSGEYTVWGPKNAEGLNRANSSLRADLATDRARYETELHFFASSEEEYLDITGVDSRTSNSSNNALLNYFNIQLAGSALYNVEPGTRPGVAVHGFSVRPYTWFGPASVTTGGRKTVNSNRVYFSRALGTAAVPDGNWLNIAARTEYGRFLRADWAALPASAVGDTLVGNGVSGDNGITVRVGATAYIIGRTSANRLHIQRNGSTAVTRSFRVIID